MLSRKNPAEKKNILVIPVTQGFTTVATCRAARHSHGPGYEPDAVPPPFSAPALSYHPTRTYLCARLGSTGLRKIQPQKIFFFMQKTLFSGLFFLFRFCPGTKHSLVVEVESFYKINGHFYKYEVAYLKSETNQTSTDYFRFTRAQLSLLLPKILD